MVSNDARVVEEVGLRKDAMQRTEAERGAVSRTGTKGTSTDLPKR